MASSKRTLTERFDGFQRRHRWAGFPLAVIYKFTDDQGPFLAALLTYYGFLSLFPLLLLMTRSWATCCRTTRTCRCGSSTPPSVSSR